MNEELSTAINTVVIILHAISMHDRISSSDSHVLDGGSAPPDSWGPKLEVKFHEIQTT